MLLKSFLGIFCLLAIFFFYNYQSHTNTALAYLDEEVYQETSVFKTDPNVDWRRERIRKGIPAQSDDLFSESWTDYKAGNTQSAISFLENIKESGRGNISDQARLNIAYINYQLGKFEASIEDATPLRQCYSVEIRHKAQWLLVNAYLQTQNKIELDNLINKIIDEPKHTFYASAVKLQADLNSFWRIGN